MNGTELSPRVRALCDLNVAEAREASGRHEYDGIMQDLSPAGVREGLAALAAAREASTPLADAHDEAHLAAFEELAQVVYGDLELHRSNPLLHLGEMDVSCYDRDYAPQIERDAARIAHLSGWPHAADHAIEALDRLSRPVANSLVGAVRGLSAGIPPGTEPAIRDAALAAHARLTGHVEHAAAIGPPDVALGGPGLSALLSSGEAMPVDLGRLAEQADAERDRLLARLTEDCALLDPGRPPLDVARELVRDHPDGAGVLDGGADLDPAGDRLHPGEGPRALLRRGVPRRPGAGIAALGGGHDVVERPGRAGRPVVVLHHSPGRDLAGPGGRGMAGDVQRHHIARDHRARGRARALLARPGAAARPR